MTISEMYSVMNDLKPKIKEKFNLIDLWYDIKENEEDSLFYKCVTIISVEQGMFANHIFISKDINNFFVEQSLEAHIEGMLSELPRGGAR